MVVAKPQSGVVYACPKGVYPRFDIRWKPLRIGFHDLESSCQQTRTPSSPKCIPQVGRLSREPGLCHHLSDAKSPFAKMDGSRPSLEREPLNVDDGTLVTSRFTEEERARIARARQQSNVVVITRPKALGYFSIAFIIVNRMVGEYVVTN